ncbi:MAG: hypothetical protein RL318_2376 [Fibrobacterota bacterium]
MLAMIGVSMGIWIPTDMMRPFLAVPLGLGLLALAGTALALKRIRSTPPDPSDAKDGNPPDLLRSIMGSTRYLVISTDLQGLITSINPAAEQELGWTLEELRSLEATPAILHDPEEVAERSREQNIRWNTDFSPGFSTFSEPASRKEFNEIEWWYIRRNGTRFRVILSITSILDSEGVIIGYLGVARDKTADLAMEQERRLLQRAVEASPAAVLITDANGIIVYANPVIETISGYPREALIQQPSSMLESELNAPDLDEDILATTMHGDSWQGEICNARKDGQLYWIDATISRMNDSSGNLANFVWVIEDITQRRQAMEELQKAKENAENTALAKTDFLSTMSHEIRTPLNALVGISNLLAKNEPREDQQENIRILQTSGQHLMALVNDILDFSKIDSGRLELEHTVFSCRDLCRSVTGSLLPQAQEKNISLDLFWHEGAVDWISADPVRLRQVLTNIIGNAIKFTHEGGVILRVRASGLLEGLSGLEFSINDTGIGIPRTMLHKIFEQFSQAESSTTRRFGGTGLGLAISSRLVDAMGGVLSVSSSQGKGSTFTFQIMVPLANPPLEPDAAPLAQPTTTLASRRLLLVEDNPVNTMVVGQFLDLWQLDWSHAENGQEAVNMGLSKPFDIVLMDLQMPVMDGYQATRHLRDAGFSAPIIALTASALNDRRQLAMELGMDDFVTKPFVPEELEAKLIFWLTHGRNGKSMPVK